MIDDTTDMKNNEISKIENLSETEIRVHFVDGTTLRMARKAFENGSWKRGTDLRLIREING